MMMENGTPAMLVGLDVGGTNTDAALVDARTGAVLEIVKAPTRKGDVLPGMIDALTLLLRGKDAGRIRRVSVSTTLGLNALLSYDTLPVGMLVVPGPGIEPRLFWPDDPLFHVLSGAQDHRGRIIVPPDLEEVRAAFAACRQQGAKALGVVCKFSPKNAELENTLAELARREFGRDMPIVCGSSVSGSLNFPRRMHTAWCNAALAAASRDFVQGLEQATSALGLACPLVVLKADAGVFSIAEAVRDPAGSMGSGAAASLLGVWALRHASAGAVAADTLMMDMGGTTTDLALLAGGQPLLAPDGLYAAGRPMLVRSLWTRSFALGGDSSLRLGSDGELRIGPDRQGPALALGTDAPGQEHAAPTRPPTLTDALNVLGLAAVGNAALSRGALADLAGHASSPADTPEKLARLFIDAAFRRIRAEVETLLAEVNSQPVYTIRELLLQQAVRPERAVFIGGPSQSLAAEAESALGMPVDVPRASACANAVGAALARPTRAAELYADTQLGRMRIPELGVDAAIGPSYTVNDAQQDMTAAFIADSQRHEGAGMDVSDVQFVYAESFAMLDDRGGRGRSIRVRAQRAAGLLNLAHDGATVRKDA